MRDSRYTFLDVFLTIESIKSGFEAISLSFPGQNRKKLIFGSKIGQKTMFFEFLSKLILSAYRQNLHEDSLNIAAHDDTKIELLFQDFPG